MWPFKKQHKHTWQLLDTHTVTVYNVNMFGDQLPTPSGWYEKIIVQKCSGCGEVRSEKTDKFQPTGYKGT